MPNRGAWLVLLYYCRLRPHLQNKIIQRLVGQAEVGEAGLLRYLLHARGAGLGA